MHDASRLPPLEATVRRRVRLAAWAGIVGLLLYIGGWFVAGLTAPGFDPTQQAISELFAQGVAWRVRGPVVVGLLVSGAALVAFAWAVDRTAPGRGRAGPALIALAGVSTLLVVAAPCSPGCPGTGASGIDLAHTFVAGTGYLSLALAPLVLAWRLRPHWALGAAVSAAIGGASLVGFAVRYLDVVTAVPGLQQRAVNTLADVWYLLAAVWILRVTRVASVSRGGTGRG
ncbi:MAG: DUF998 domain-containing protein [Nitriliruptoraceae bacterium]|nr:DUF998 domain-containing protein [Nitriliruptoraceae bacterium]